MAIYLGIDIGTSSVKITAIGEAGSVLATVSTGYAVEEPQPGWREIDPEVWWCSVCDAMVRLSSSIDVSSIAGVGVTGQMHTIVLMDAAGRPTCRSIMWNDLRTMEDEVSAQEAIEMLNEHQIARNISAGSPALSLAWIRRNDPKAFERTVAFTGVPDWIARRLGGRTGTDWCGASTSSLFNVVEQTWSPEACKLFGVPEEMLPHIDDADCIIGEISVEASFKTGIPAGTPIVRGTGDNPAAAIPTGCLSQGVPVISLGTSGVLMYAQEGVYQPSFGKPVLFKSKEKLKTLVQLTVKSCGSDMEWWVKGVLGRASFSLEDSRVEDVRHDMRGLLFFPHLNGEKVLYSNPSLRGAFFGLGLDTTRSEMTRAVMEGISFGFRSLWETVERSGDWDVLRLVGGGAKSILWASIICNVLGIGVMRMKTSGAGQGAAMLALSAVTGESLEAIAAQSMEPLDIVAPDARVQKAYDSKFILYGRIYKALESIYRR